jgi:PPOX class probable F420-dependent enzyme
MDHDEWRAFVREGTRTGKLAVTRKNGMPHVVPIWFVLDGDDVVFTTGESVVKAKALRRDPRAALCVDLEAPPYNFVAIEGMVQLSDDRDEMLEWATKIGARYMGAARAEEFGRRNAAAGEIMVRLTPQRVIAIADMTE